MNNMLKFAFKYGKLPSVQRNIIEFLYLDCNGEFVGNYSDLSRVLGQKVSICVHREIKHGNEPNIRKYALKLEKQGILKIAKNGRNVKSIALADNWVDNI